MVELDKWNYFMEDGEMFRVEIRHDDDPDNPRTEMDGNLGEMYCEHRNYKLGDNTDYNDIDGLKRAMIEEAGISDRQIINYAKSGKGNVSLKYDRSEHEWQVWGSYYLMPFGRVDNGVIESDVDVNCLIDTIIEGLSIDDIIAVSKDNIVALNVYLYDHSCISISTESFIGRAQHAEWDSGCVGVIWATLSRAKKETGYKFKTNKEWRKYVVNRLEDEVKLYDQYIQGDCYFYDLEVYREETEEWEHIEGCGGYYPVERWDYESLLTDEFGKDFKCYDTEEEAREAA